MFGLAREEALFNYTKPLFSRDYDITNREAKMMRMGVAFGGPIEVDGTRFKTRLDRSDLQELFVADW